jgi:phage baseplate assembly protein W
MMPPRSGIAFPFRLAAGRVLAATGPEKVAQDLRHLLATRTGERTMLRAYGGALHHYRQAPNDATLRALFRHEVEQAIRVFLPEVRLTGPIGVAAEEALVRVTLHYALDVDATPRRLELEVG